jgi:hypothetical protein
VNVSGDSMGRFTIAILLAGLIASPAVAQETCQSKAIGRDGRPLPWRGAEQLRGKVQGRSLRTEGDRQERKVARRRRKDILHEEVPNPGVSRTGAAAVLRGSGARVDPSGGMMRQSLNEEPPVL